MFDFQRIFETFQFITGKSKQKQADKYKCVDEVVTICSMLGGCLRPTRWFDGFLHCFFETNHGICVGVSDLVVEM